MFFCLLLFSSGQLGDGCEGVMHYLYAVEELGSHALAALSTHTQTAKTLSEFELSRHYKTFVVDITIASRSNFSPHEHFVLFDVFVICLQLY